MDRALLEICVNSEFEAIWMNRMLTDTAITKHEMWHDVLPAGAEARGRLITPRDAAFVHIAIRNSDMNLFSHTIKGRRPCLDGKDRFRSGKSAEHNGAVPRRGSSLLQIADTKWKQLSSQRHSGLAELEW